MALPSLLPALSGALFVACAAQAGELPDRLESKRPLPSQTTDQTPPYRYRFFSDDPEVVEPTLWPVETCSPVDHHGRRLCRPAPEGNREAMRRHLNLP